VLGIHPGSKRICAAVRVGVRAHAFLFPYARDVCEYVCLYVCER
jgi:hypothetical protein